MNEATVTAIETMAKADPAATPEIIRALKKACTSQPKPAQVVNARRAMEILEITRPTLRRLARAGKLHETKDLSLNRA